MHLVGHSAQEPSLHEGARLCVDVGGAHERRRVRLEHARRQLVAGNGALIVEDGKALGFEVPADQDALGDQAVPRCVGHLVGHTDVRPVLPLDEAFGVVEVGRAQELGLGVLVEGRPRVPVGEGFSRNTYIHITETSF